MESRFLLLVLAAAVPAAATPAEVTEESLLASLRADHTALAAASAVEEESRAESLRAKLLPNPSVGYGTERPSGATKQDEWGVSWALPFDGRYGARRAVAREGEAVASARADGMRLGARLRLRAAFAAWLRASERAAALTRHAESLAALAAQARARATAGEATGLEARRLELEASEARGDLAAAEVERDTARSSLFAWIVLPADAVPVRSSLPEGVADLDASASPSVRLREAEARAAEAERTLASRLLFSPEVRAGYQTQRDPAGTEHSGPVFSASVSLPLFERGQAEHARAAARLRSAQAELALARAAAAAQAPVARTSFARLAAAAATARAALADVSLLESAARAAWTAGEMPLTDLLDTLRSALGVRLRDAESHAAALAAHAALEAAAGRPLTGEAR
ncbi:MAG: TolC family protein [Thermoanaerobaculia bacterium]